MTKIVQFFATSPACPVAQLVVEHRAMLARFRDLDARSVPTCETAQQERQQALADALELTLTDIQSRVVRMTAASGEGAMFQLFRLYAEVEHLASLVPDSREHHADEARERALALVQSIGTWMANEQGIDPASVGADYFLPKTRSAAD